MGASASGKSLLMRVLAGRVQDLHITGDVTINGTQVDPRNIKNNIGYVPQDDILLGELSARDMLRNSALMRRSKPVEVIDATVDKLLTDFGLENVADNPIGTVFVRGLSGGQKKRVDVGTELIAAPTILLLDEPTSGLDGSIAFEVLSVIKSILKASEGRLSIMMSIHQPNSRILELFDHILLLGGGGMLFFGTVPESIDYFSNIGFSPPKNYTPTDFFLQVSDTNFGTNSDFDFEGSFHSSVYSVQLGHFLESVKKEGEYTCSIVPIDSSVALESGTANNDHVEARAISDGDEVDIGVSVADYHRGGTSLWRQYSTLVKRDFVLAYKDPSLYYLQFVLISGFGFLVGAVFLDQKYEINSAMSNIPGALLWIVMMNCYMLVFKVYHLSKADKRFKHERSNNTYSVLAYWLADLTSTSILLVSYFPSGIIAYGMVGFPNEAYPFLLFVFGW